MLRFLRKVLRKFQTANTTGTPRQAPRRARLGLEGLEDRMVLSAATASFNTATGLLTVTDNVSFDQITFKVDHIQHNKVDVFEGTTKIKQISIDLIKTVDVNLQSIDTVIVNDSNGFPFAPGTTISLTGSGSGNSFNLSGSHTISGGETYVGGDDLGEGQLLLPSTTQPTTTFNFDGTVSSVTDSVKSTGRFDVQTSSGNVTLSGSDGVTQTLSGLGINGSAVNKLMFSNKSVVQLEEFAANANVTLNATAPDAGEQSFTLLLTVTAADDVADIAAAPVTTNINVSGNSQFVNLLANAAPVTIQGNSTTHFNLGGPTPDGLTTAGIQANVTVHGVGLLLVDDVDNNTTQENVKVTPTTISGTGLFGSTSTVLHENAKASTNIGIGSIGNNAPEVQYDGIGKLQFFAGQGFEKYSVSGANFSNPIEIDGSSAGGLDINVGVVATSNLHMVVNNASKASGSAELVFSAPGATVTKPPFQDSIAPDLSGTEAATFPIGVQSAVTYTDFSDVLAFGRQPLGGGETPETRLSGMDKTRDFGHGSGSYTTSAIFSSAPHGYQLTGIGTFLNLGTMEITGSVGTVGGFATGEARGELTFTNAKGSVTIQLIGPEQRGFSALPSTFEYSVKKATGAYAGLTGFGSLTLKLGPASGHGLKLSGDFSLTINTFERLTRLETNS
jgi:hypothetical protein